MHPTPAKLAEDGTTSPFLQATQENLPTSVTFTVFSLLITVFAKIASTLNYFGCNAPLQSSDLSQVLKCFTN